MAHFINPFRANNFIDSNILNEVADGQRSAVNEIVRLADGGQLSVLLPYSVRDEIQNPATPDYVKKAGDTFVFSMKVELNAEEVRRCADVLAATKGETQDKNIAPDLFHVCEAAKYGGGYFITRDKPLLARSGAIAGLLQIDVVTPDDFLNRVAQGREI